MSTTPFGSSGPPGPTTTTTKPVEFGVARVTADVRDAQPAPGHRRGDRVRDHSPASARTAFTNASIGGFTTPAPIWPTPGSRCAIPVFTNGSRRVCTTSRHVDPERRPAEAELRDW